jgi:hypothetical protein
MKSIRRRWEQWEETDLMTLCEWYVTKQDIPTLANLFDLKEKSVAAIVSWVRQTKEWGMDFGYRSY